ncbi:MAG: segregation/condensation protein A [Candidatus Pacearchaeota archaeon]|jgi:segregation and condensation protein A
MQNEENKNITLAKQEQIHDLLFSRELGWQEIIYDLINTEELDPWDLNITLLTNKFLEKINELEEMDFFISSKVLLAAALLLRIKSEILLNKYIKSIDEILFGSEEKKKHVLERIELEDEIPELVPRSPMPRYRKVTLQELMESLNKAIITENRRIKKEIITKNALRRTNFSMPKKNFSIKDKIKEIYEKVNIHFEKNKDHKKITFTKLIGENKDERIFSFSPLLHLENQNKLWLEQVDHFEEIHIWLKKVFIKHNGDPFAELREEISKEAKPKRRISKKRLKKIKNEFSEPLAGI